MAGRIPIVAMLAAAAFAAAAERDAAPTTIAVLNFTNRNPGNGWDWLEKGLADLLITDLSCSARLQVVARERMQRLIEELALQAEAARQDEALRALGRVVEAQQLLTGTFWVEQGRLTIQAHLVAVATGELLRLERVEGEGGRVLDLEKALALAVVTRLGLPLSAEERASLLRLPTRKVDAAAEFYRGIEAWDRGEPADALAMFRSAARADPAYDEARFRQGQMFALLGEPEHAVVVFRQLLADRPGESFEADALFWLGQLCLDTLGRPAEAVACFTALTERKEPFTLRSMRAFRFAQLGTLQAREFPRLLLADALEARGDFPAAGRIYAEMYRPFIKTSHFQFGVADDSGDVRFADGVPGSGLLRSRFQRFLSRAAEATGSVPILPCGMIVLGPGDRSYQEDFRTDKRFRDGFAIESWDGPHHRNCFQPGSFWRRPEFVGSGGGCVSDEYIVVARPGHWIRRLDVSLTASGDAGLQASALGVTRKLRFKSSQPVTRGAGFDFPPGVQQLSLDVIPYNGKIRRWRLEAGLEPTQPVGRLRVDTQPRGAAVTVDGEFRGYSPLSLGSVLPGKHVVRAFTPDTCPRCGRRHHQWLRQFGVYQVDEVNAQVEAGQTAHVLCTLRQAEPPLPGWGPPEKLPCSRGSVALLPDGSARLFAEQEGDIWTAAAPRPGEWSELTRLPMPISSVAREENPRCVLAADRRIALLWGVPEPDRYAFFLSRSTDGRRWSYPHRVASSTQIPCGVEVACGPGGKLYLVWSTYAYQSREHGVFLQEMAGDQPVGKPRLAITSAELGGNVDLVPSLVFAPSGRALLFVGGGVTTSADLVEWTPLRLLTCGWPRRDSERAAWVGADGRIVLATRGTSHESGGSPPDRIGLHASRDLKRWTELGALDIHMARLRFLRQPDGLPALLWAVDDLWLCRAEVDPFSSPDRASARRANP